MDRFQSVETGAFGVASVTIGSGSGEDGEDYTAGILTATGGGGTGFSGAITVNSGAINSATVTNAGQGYTSAPTIVINDAADCLIGQEPTESVINNAGQIARNSIKPITDMRGTVEFRHQLSDVLTRRALNAAITRAKGGSINDH